MSNLGLYQTVVTFMKRVGGPAKAITLVVGGSALVGGACVKAIEWAKDAVSAKKAADAKRIQSMKTYVVAKEGTSNEGLPFQEGEEFRVLERDGNAVLIEKLGDEKSPYFVAADFLETISDYQA